MRPWWSLKSGQARQREKAEDAKRRGIDDDANRQFVKLCRKFKLRHDASIKARMDGDRLVLYRDKISFALSLENYTEFYLKKVCEILLRGSLVEPHPSHEAAPTRTSREQQS